MDSHIIHIIYLLILRCNFGKENSLFGDDFIYSEIINKYSFMFSIHPEAVRGFINKFMILGKK